MNTHKVTLKEKIGYGLGDAASSMFWKLFGMYLLFFYTDIFGIEAGIVGTMFLITRVWDSLFDPVVGILGDRTESRWGKFRPYLLWIALPFGILGVLTFTTPDWNVTGKIIYAYITYSLMMMVYSLINVPYASLLGVMSSDPKERTALSSYRMIFAFLGSILALVLIEPLVKIFGNDGQNLTRGWSLAAFVFAGIAVAFFWCTFSWTKERVRPIKESRNPLKDDVKDLLGNKPWWILLGAGIAALIFNSIRDGAAVYYFKYYAVAPEAFNLGIFGSALSLTTLYLVLGQAANILGILLVSPVSNRIGKKNAYLFAMVLATLLSIGFFFIDKENIGLMLLLQVLISACAGSIFPLLWSMYADIADFSEWKTGRRATGLIFSSSSMSQKFGWSIGGALTGWLLAYFGFQANVEQTATAQEGIRMMLSILPAAGTLLSVVFIYFYPLTEQKLKEITADLNLKRTNQ
ncbi:MFS transporter [Parabacteroides sp. PF5-6]|uniref:MFS transporter n=1 Tax=Parabacteroides sp. PF5-6 TaxID=1742403 RepID=UPI002406CEA8|nr:MFS transporter [Parabacteroides sp. PF5-6]MDF9828818.1 GPH family glycoside/pentoside/hexuronide:cation symporter [Parabacteroides sp. PF5-6]